MGLFDKKEKTADEYLEEAHKHAHGNSSAEKAASVIGGGVNATVTAGTAYAGYRVGSFLNNLSKFVKASDKAEFPLRAAFHRSGSTKDNFSDLYNEHRDKFWTRTGETAAAEMSSSKALSAEPLIAVEIETPTALEHAYQAAGKSYKNMTSMFSKDTIRSLFKENRGAAVAIGSLAAVSGIVSTLSALKDFEEKHDQEVADNFKQAIRLDNAALVKEVKETASDKPLTIVQARSIAHDRADIALGMTPDSRQKPQQEIKGKHSESVVKADESAKTAGVTV